ncbi:hypothetical protein WJX73_004870 [Symbiochloris irregularis]|uniref:Helicase-associated domain-containing protein n=1 Tax=Symbiochloris irregularis TaxID=706552 RepID=A0AAW1NUM8_9CHLO
MPTLALQVRRGVGWGEEILPHLTVEQRVLKRNRSAQPDPWTENSAEYYLRDVCGIPEKLVDAVLVTAVAWRVTPGGRALIDRRRRCRCERNMPLVSEYLQDCGVRQGRKGVGAIFMQVPQIMLCKPNQNDRWDRRAIELAAFWLQNGHCNVPEDCQQYPELGPWVRRQRTVQQQGTLSEQRLSILEAIGFDFGNEAQITEEWETRFDQLVDWLLWKEGKVGSALDWVGLEWGAQGGLRAREVVLWSQLQREFKKRCLLPDAAIKRLDAIGFCWDPQVGQPADVRWMDRLGSLLYVIERQKRALEKRAQAQYWLQQRLHVQNGELPDDAPLQEVVESSSKPPPLSAAAAKDLMVWSSESPVMLRKGFGIWATHEDKDLAWLQKEVPQRSAAMASANFEPGQGTWLAHQRWLWRHGRLTPEQCRLLRLVGMELVLETADGWRAAAHEAAFFMHGCGVGKGLEQLEAASMACIEDGTDASLQTSPRSSTSRSPPSRASRLHPELVLPAQAFAPPSQAKVDLRALQRLSSHLDSAPPPGQDTLYPPRQPYAAVKTLPKGDDMAETGTALQVVSRPKVTRLSVPAVRSAV